MSARGARAGQHERGQGLVEFAVVLPLFLIMLLAVLDLGRVVWANNVLGSAAREAARFAIVHGGTATNPCPVGPPGPKTKIPPASTSCPYPSPSKEAIREVARQAAIAGGAPVVVTVCYGAGCVGDTDTTTPQPATNVRGTPVTVRVSSSIALVTGGLLQLGNFTPVGSSTMLVNF